MKLKSALLLLVILMGIMTAVSCKRKKGDRNPKHFVQALSAEPQTLNPISASDTYESAVNGFVFCNLLNLDKNLEIIPELAESWEISDDHKTFTFHIRKDVYWHDGEKLTGEDVKYTYDKIMDPRSKAMNKRGEYKDVEYVELVDDYTFRAHYKTPYAAALLSWAALTVIPKHIYENLDKYEDDKEYSHVLYVRGNEAFKSLSAEERAEAEKLMNEDWAAKLEAAGIVEAENPTVKTEFYEPDYEAAIKPGKVENGIGKAMASIMADSASSIAKYAAEFAAEKRLIRPTFLNNKFNRAPIGCGPYRFVKWDTAQQIVLEKVKDHWRDNPAIELIRFKIIKNADAELKAYKVGDIDVVTMRPEKWEEEKNDEMMKKRSQFFEYYSPGFGYIGWNMNGSNPFFADAKVRRAMTHATPREDMIEAILYGHAKTLSAPFHPDSWAYDSSVRPLDFDLDKSKALLTEAGWVDSDNNGIRDKMIGEKKVEFRFDILLGEGSIDGKRALLLLQEQLKSIGVLMEIRQLEWSALANKVHAKDFTACAMGWSLTLDPDPYLLFHSSEIAEGLNYYSYSNARADTIIEEAQVEFDRERRKELYHELHRIFNKDQPYTLLWAKKTIAALSRRFGNVETSPISIMSHYPGIYDWTIDEDF